jgi:transcriptional regulator with XRE-family HTH domain
MTFHQKLEQLSSDRNKAEISRRAGLSISGLSNYLAQPKRIPRADIAFRLACALNVELEWLLDSKQGWPPRWTNRLESESSHLPQNNIDRASKKERGRTHPAVA